MKISLFVLFINISYVVSNNVDIFDELYLKKNTNNQASVHILPRSSRETDLEILALILKVDSNDNNKCKEQLKAYCEKLRKLNPDLKDMDIKLKEICENDETSEQKCAGIDQRIKEKCDELRENLLKIKKVGSNHCNTYERQCLFMSEACRGLITEACYRLRERCYKKRRDDVADEIALRAVNENMINWWYCESFLEKACVFLNKESDELMLLCLQSRATCQRLVLEKSQICFGIKNEIHFTLQNIDNRRCYELLEKCYYYAKVCVEAYKPDCRALENYCKNKNITYLPLDTSVNPIENDKGIVEKLRLDEFYRRTEFWGVIIGKPSGKDLKDLIILISQFFKGNNMVEKCLDALTNGCIYYKTYRRDLADLCNDRNNREKNCKLILDNTASKCQDLKKALFDKGLSSESGDSKSKFYNWENLPKSLTKEDCVQLISACFYFEPVCVNKVIEACLNAKMACYKIGLEASANELLETQLRGKINGLGLDKNKGESCQKNLIQQCKMLENSNAEVCALCIEPEKACEILKDDINFRANLLNTDLNKKRDSPKEKDCVELEKKCEDILQDSDLVKLPCNTLKRNCKHLRATKKLRESILEENNNSLDSLENCIKVLEKKCNKLLTEPISRDLFDTMNHCSALGNNIRKYNVFINATRDHQQEKICTYWGPYCNKFAMNCPKVLLNGENGENNGPCARLERACKPFWEKRNLENDIINMLKGNLTSKEQCNLALSDHCISWINGENITLRDLCKNMTAKNDQKAQDELCQKLIDLVKKRCNLQHSELRKKKGEAEEKNKIFEELKKQVEENIKNFNLNLSIFNLGNKKERNNTNTQEMLITDIIQFSLFWEENSTIQMTEKEAAAFKTLTRMILLYSDLKVLCKPLELECSFRNDCLPYKEICGEIDIRRQQRHSHQYRLRQRLRQRHSHQYRLRQRLRQRHSHQYRLRQRLRQRHSHQYRLRQRLRQRHSHQYRLRQRLRQRHSHQYRLRQRQRQRHSHQYRLRQRLRQRRQQQRQRQQRPNQ
ncbi:hypothetical protein MERGE_002117 [Pneumocystis wakefieldiae]|uniref:Major surface glycoprotein 2 C-terminal domain-containing protein n=1 Tax=Pneumocystis wakefieldiae TaxID=38082 RepID=A0A899FWZ9_9ASCO|nr:hypothetical protein MERGE_002117 [Pneumocystis wakefieldiae]